MNALRWTIPLLLLAGAPATARAQPTPDAEAVAKAHYERGITLYNLSKWDEAIAEFKKAYELSKAPGLVFNVAQAQRLKGDHRGALESYRSYLRLDPSAPNRAETEARIGELDKLVKEEDARKPPAKPPDKAPPPDKVMRVDANVMRVEVAGQEQDRSNRTLLHAGLITAGVGLVITAYGAYYGVKASSEWDDVEVTVATHGPWMHEDQQNWEDAEDHERLSKVCLIVGGVAVATGAVLTVFGTGALESWVAAAPAPGGGSVFVRGEF